MKKMLIMGLLMITSGYLIADYVEFKGSNDTEKGVEVRCGQAEAEIGTKTKKATIGLNCPANIKKIILNFGTSTSRLELPLTVKDVTITGSKSAKIGRVKYKFVNADGDDEDTTKEGLNFSKLYK